MTNNRNEVLNANAEHSLAALITHDLMLKELFKNELNEVYWAEKQTVEMLPEMINAASSGKLKRSFKAHLEVTKTHFGRLENAFKTVGEFVQQRKCKSIQVIANEIEKIIDEPAEDSAAKDAQLIAASQKLSSYEIATYGNLARLTKILGYDHIVEFFTLTLNEEKKFNRYLTNIEINNMVY